MPYKWDVQFKESLDTCRTIYVQDVKEQNLVNMGNSVLVSSTITTDQDYLEDHMYANEVPPDRSKCISQLILEICQCLPWQYNSQVERLTCNDQETLNCSMSVRNLWKKCRDISKKSSFSEFTLLGSVKLILNLEFNLFLTFCVP